MPTNSKEYMEKYYQKNKDHIKGLMMKRLHIDCYCEICEIYITKANMWQHKRTNKHRANTETLKYMFPEKFIRITYSLDSLNELYNKSSKHLCKQIRKGLTIIKDLDVYFANQPVQPVQSVTFAEEVEIILKRAYSDSELVNKKTIQKTNSDSQLFKKMNNIIPAGTEMTMCDCCDEIHEVIPIL